MVHLRHLLNDWFGLRMRLLRYNRMRVLLDMLRLLLHWLVSLYFLPLGWLLLLLINSYRDARWMLSLGVLSAGRVALGLVSATWCIQFHVRSYLVFHNRDFSRRLFDWRYLLLDFPLNRWGLLSHLGSDLSLWLNLNRRTLDFFFQHSLLDWWRQLLSHLSLLLLCQRGWRFVWDVISAHILDSFLISHFLGHLQNILSIFLANPASRCFTSID